MVEIRYPSTNSEIKSHCIRNIRFLSNCRFSSNDKKVSEWFCDQSFAESLKLFSMLLGF